MPDIVLKELQEQIADFHNRWQTATVVNQQQAETLAAAQAAIAKLREALTELQEYFELGTVGNEFVTKALDIPTDTTALQERLKDERKKCIDALWNVEVTGLAAASLPQGPCGLPGYATEVEE